MSNTYTFTCEADGEVVSITTDSLTWTELTEVYVRFLRGVGFVLPSRYAAELVFEDDGCKTNRTDEED